MELNELLLGGNTKQHLSQRVIIIRAITEQQSQSEKLISIVQLLIVVIFAGLYLASPKPEHDTGFVLVPWVLAAYFGFTVARGLYASVPRSALGRRGLDPCRHAAPFWPDLVVSPAI